MSRIDFRTSDQPNVWIGLSEGGSRRRALNAHGAPLWARVWNLALTRVDRDGHSQWFSDELAESIEVVDRVTGALVAPSARNTRRAVERLVEFGWITPDSTTRCLRFPIRDVQNGTGRSGLCRTHR